MKIFGFHHFFMLNPKPQAIWQKSEPIQRAAPVALHIS